MENKNQPAEGTYIIIYLHFSSVAAPTNEYSLVIDTRMFGVMDYMLLKVIYRHSG